MTALLSQRRNQVYLFSRCLKCRDRSYVSSVLSHPLTAKIAVLQEWIHDFKALLCDDAAVAADDNTSKMPFMYLHDTPLGRDYRKFRERTVQDLSAACGAADRRAALTASGWLDFLQQQCADGDADSLPVLQSKMFLFCVVAFEWFDNADSTKRCCPALFDVVRGDVARILRLSDREVRLFEAFADYTRVDRTCQDDVTYLFFRDDFVLVLDDRRLRRVVLASIAVTLGLPRASHPLHTHLFEPWILKGTFGVGSERTEAIMAPGVHYDCVSWCWVVIVLRVA